MLGPDTISPSTSHAGPSTAADNHSLLADIVFPGPSHSPCVNINDLLQNNLQELCSNPRVAPVPSTSSMVANSPPTSIPPLLRENIENISVPLACESGNYTANSMDSVPTLLTHTELDSNNMSNTLANSSECADLTDNVNSKNIHIPCKTQNVNNVTTVNINNCPDNDSNSANSNCVISNSVIDNDLYCLNLGDSSVFNSLSLDFLDNEFNNCTNASGNVNLDSADIQNITNNYADNVINNNIDIVHNNSSTSCITGLPQEKVLPSLVVPVSIISTSEETVNTVNNFANSSVSVSLPIEANSNNNSNTTNLPLKSTNNVASVSERVTCKLNSKPNNNTSNSCCKKSKCSKLSKCKECINNLASKSSNKNNLKECEMSGNDNSMRTPTS